MAVNSFEKQYLVKKTQAYNTDRDKRCHETKTKSEGDKSDCKSRNTIFKIRSFLTKTQICDKQQSGMLTHTQYGHMMSLHEKHVNKSLS